MPSKTRKRTFSRKRRQGSKKNMIKLIKKVSNQASEKKYFAVESGGGQVVNDTFTVTSISNIPQSTTAATDITRLGDQVYIRSIEFNWALYAADTPEAGYVRVILFQWYPDSTPVGTQILLSTTNALDQWLAPYNHDGRFNYRILYDRTDQVYPDGRILGVSHKVKLTRGFKRRIQFTAGTTTANNKIYVLKIGSYPNGDANDPFMNNVSKINFSDM